jgi:lipopolysaccharide/colanic/teichoic acid biosynthesis glycosyltransferase
LIVGPIIAALSLAIRLDSKGPIFFARCAWGATAGRSRSSSSLDGRGRRRAQGRALALNEVGDGMFKLSRDPRVTRVGSFLRRTSLDELPSSSTCCAAR